MSITPNAPWPRHLGPRFKCEFCGHEGKAVGTCTYCGGPVQEVANATNAGQRMTKEEHAELLRHIKHDRYWSWALNALVALAIIGIILLLVAGTTGCAASRSKFLDLGL